jgi:hypothetical protein
MRYVGIVLTRFHGLLGSGQDRSVVLGRQSPILVQRTQRAFSSSVGPAKDRSLACPSRSAVDASVNKRRIVRLGTSISRQESSMRHANLQSALGVSRNTQSLNVNVKFINKVRVRLTGIARNIVNPTATVGAEYFPVGIYCSSNREPHAKFLKAGP